MIEYIRILTHIIGSFGQTSVSVADVYDGRSCGTKSTIIYHAIALVSR
ncbi:MAG: hypothetical protein V7K97_05645 [Nostoc sp.]